MLISFLYKINHCCLIKVLKIVDINMLHMEDVVITKHLTALSSGKKSGFLTHEKLCFD